MNSSKIYIHSYTVKGSDIDELMHVNNVKYLSFLQEAAMAHWYATVPKDISDALRWVVKKHEIEYFNPAFENDMLEIKTWIADFSGVISHRFYEIWKADRLIVKANTLWVALDANTLKPKRIPQAIVNTYFFNY